MKKFLSLAMAILMVLSLGACSKKEVPISEMVEIHVQQEIVDGQRIVMFWYDNNSGREITYLNMHYRLNDDVTKDMLPQEYADTLGEDYTVDYIFYDGEVESSTADGETSEKVEFYRNNIFFVRDETNLDLIRPDIMTVKYIGEDGREVTLYYDYVQQVVTIK